MRAASASAAALASGCPRRAPACSRRSRRRRSTARGRPGSRRSQLLRHRAGHPGDAAAVEHLHGDGPRIGDLDARRLGGARPSGPRPGRRRADELVRGLLARLGARREERLDHGRSIVALSYTTMLAPPAASPVGRRTRSGRRPCRRATGRGAGSRTGTRAGTPSPPPATTSVLLLNTRNSPGMFSDFVGSPSCFFSAREHLLLPGDAGEVAAVVAEARVVRARRAARSW